MRLVRILYRIPLLAAWSVMVSAAAAFYGVGGWRGIVRVTGCTEVWCRGLLFLMGIRLRVFGKMSGPGCLIISNHTGYLDIIVHGALGRVRFASKKEVKYYPGLGLVLASSRPVWIDRKNRAASQQALAEFNESLRRGVNLIVYPEGTTTDGMHGLLVFKSTAFESACETGHPIQPVITRTGPAADGFNVAWYGDQTLLPHLGKVLGLAGLDSRIYLLPVQKALPGESRKQLAERMHDLMERAGRVIDSGDQAAIGRLLSDAESASEQKQRRLTPFWRSRFLTLNIFGATRNNIVK
ncbi:MAG: lysophospholipid acyltransferase family protein [Victivallaceae bacterium]|nr:lysophospholipid acyltransferase family protein [Victivallaceae bacterium]